MSTADPHEELHDNCRVCGTGPGYAFGSWGMTFSKEERQYGIPLASDNAHP